MGLRTRSIETLFVLKLDKHSYEIHINLSFICLTLLCLICALSLYLAQKLLRKVKIPQVCKKVVANAKMCSDVAEHDRNRRIRVFISISDSFATLTCEISCTLHRKHVTAPSGCINLAPQFSLFSTLVVKTFLF